MVVDVAGVKVGFGVLAFKELCCSKLVDFARFDFGVLDSEELCCSKRVDFARFGFGVLDSEELYGWNREDCLGHCEDLCP